jgi:hypothetical protein
MVGSLWAFIIAYSPFPGTYSIRTSHQYKLDKFISNDDTTDVVGEP